MQHLIFEYSPLYIIVCIALGIGYAFILYRAKHAWSKKVNQGLFLLRAVLVALLAFLLIGPILKLTNNIFEKPTMVFLVDNSLSISETLDSLERQKIRELISKASKSIGGAGFEVVIRNLSANDEALIFNQPNSDLTGAIRSVTSDYEGKNLASIVLLSDGIYNSGASPLYSPLRIPINTIGLGDTTQRTDLVLKNLAFNKIAYQGNKYPLRAEVQSLGLANQEVKVSVFQTGKLLAQQIKNSGNKSLLIFDFQLEANEKGLQQILVVVEPHSLEANEKNNRSSAFIEVVEGKKKILVIAPAPHPDLKALRSVIEKNSNYEFILHIPGVQEVEANLLQPGKADLVVFHEVLDIQRKTTALYTRLSKGPSSLMVIISKGTDVRSLAANGIPLIFENSSQWDDVTPVINPIFRDFGFAENVNNSFSKYPPVAVPFGKFTFPANASSLLYQRIGNVTTDRPLILTYDDNGRKTGVVISDGIWRWRLNEFLESEKTVAFDEVFSKLIQYLSSQEDKRKFRSFPIQNEFTDSEQVTFESQIYNDLYEQVYGNKVDLKITDQNGKVTSYNYITSPGGSRYRMGAMGEGVFHYDASTILDGKREAVRGEFLVTAQNIESQNLTADFGLLRKLAVGTGGKFYTTNQFDQLTNDLTKAEARSLIHSEDSFNPLINLKWVFFLLLLIVSAEWFLRKFLGAY
jgi:hypothetical protein